VKYVRHAVRAVIERSFELDSPGFSLSNAGVKCLRFRLGAIVLQGQLPVLSFSLLIGYD